MASSGRAGIPTSQRVSRPPPSGCSLRICVADPDRSSRRRVNNITFTGANGAAAERAAVARPLGLSLSLPCTCSPTSRISSRSRLPPCNTRRWTAWRCEPQGGSGAGATTIMAIGIMILTFGPTTGSSLWRPRGTYAMARSACSSRGRRTESGAGALGRCTCRRLSSSCREPTTQAPVSLLQQPAGLRDTAPIFYILQLPRLRRTRRTPSGHTRRSATRSCRRCTSSEPLMSADCLR